MYYIKFKLFLIATFIILGACSKNNINEFKFLEGTWKVENQNQFEEWEINSDGDLVGSGYKIIDGQKQTFETLVITEENNQIIYKAKVSNQNEGNTIPFTLNFSEKGLFSFENINHDFPKKIQYLKISNERIKVSVLGENDEGFSFFMDKHKNADM